MVRNESVARQIELILDSTSPPSGQVSRGAARRRFEGWLGLLRALSEFMEGENMVKATVIYGTPTDPEAFDEHYEKVHLPLAARIPDVQRVEISRGLPGPDGATPAHVIAELWWADAETMSKALASEDTAAAIEDAQKIASGGLQFLLSEVKS